MSAFVREFLQITKESAYGTIMGTPARGTDQIVIRLSGPNFFTPRETPVMVDVPYGGGLAIDAYTVSDKTEIKGTLQTELCYSQAALLLGWGLQRINSGQTSPWVTTEPINQFASCTVDHAVWRDDTGDYKRTRYTGVKVDSGKIECSEGNRKAMLSLDLVGSTYQGNTYDSSSDPDATAFPVPSDSDYPTDIVLYSHSHGGLFIGSLVTARTQYDSLSLSWQNQHDVRFFASRFAQVMRSFGRKMKLDSDLILLSSPDDRATFRTLGAQSAKVVFTNGTHTLTFDYKTNALIETLGDDLPLEKLYGRKLSLKSRWDSSAATDFLLSVA